MSLYSYEALMLLFCNSYVALIWNGAYNGFTMDLQR